MGAGPKKETSKCIITITDDPLHLLFPDGRSQRVNPYSAASEDAEDVCRTALFGCILLLDRLRVQVLSFVRGRSGLRTAEEDGSGAECAQHREEGHAAQ